MHLLFFIFTSFGQLWSLNTIILYAEYTKRPKGKKLNFLMDWYRIVSYRYRIGIILSLSVLYCILKK